MKKKSHKRKKILRIVIYLLCFLLAIDILFEYLGVPKRIVSLAAKIMASYDMAFQAENVYLGVFTGLYIEKMRLVIDTAFGPVTIVSDEIECDTSKLALLRGKIDGLTCKIGESQISLLDRQGLQNNAFELEEANLRLADPSQLQVNCKGSVADINILLIGSIKLPKSIKLDTEEKVDSEEKAEESSKTPQVSSFSQSIQHINQHFMDFINVFSTDRKRSLLEIDFICDCNSPMDTEANLNLFLGKTKYLSYSVEKVTGKASLNAGVANLKELSLKISEEKDELLINGSADLKKHIITGEINGNVSTNALFALAEIQDSAVMKKIRSNNSLKINVKIPETNWDEHIPEPEVALTFNKLSIFNTEYETVSCQAKLADAKIFCHDLIISVNKEKDLQLLGNFTYDLNAKTLDGGLHGRLPLSYILERGGSRLKKNYRISDFDATEIWLNVHNSSLDLHKLNVDFKCQEEGLNIHGQNFDNIGLSFAIKDQKFTTKDCFLTMNSAGCCGKFLFQADADWYKFIDDKKLDINAQLQTIQYFNGDQNAANQTDADSQKTTKTSDNALQADNAVQAAPVQAQAQADNAVQAAPIQAQGQADNAVQAAPVQAQGQADNAVQATGKTEQTLLDLKLNLLVDFRERNISIPHAGGEIYVDKLYHIANQVCGYRDKIMERINSRSKPGVFSFTLPQLDFSKMESMRIVGDLHIVDVLYHKLDIEQAGVDYVITPKRATLTNLKAKINHGEDLVLDMDIAYSPLSIVISNAQLLGDPAIFANFIYNKNGADTYEKIWECFSWNKEMRPEAKINRFDYIEGVTPTDWNLHMNTAIHTVSGSYRDYPLPIIDVDLNIDLPQAITVDALVDRDGKKAKANFYFMIEGTPRGNFMLEDKEGALNPDQLLRCLFAPWPQGLDKLYISPNTNFTANGFFEIGDFARYKVTIDFQTDKFGLFDWYMNESTGVVELTDNFCRWDVPKSSFLEGELATTGSYDYGASYADILVRMQKVPVKNMIAQLQGTPTTTANADAQDGKNTENKNKDDKKDMLQNGYLEAETYFRLLRDWAQRPVHMEGTGTISLTNSDIWKIPILRELGSINRMGSITEVHGDYIFKGNKVVFQKLNTNGTIISIHSTGEYNWETNQLDFQLIGEAMEGIGFLNLMFKPLTWSFNAELKGTPTNYKWKLHSPIAEFFGF